mmetsp:Transcript_63572/g.187665  ORF Transcript_63572/g.187665 Transcript_63572/m.187665 type:complete len:93 (+) Transcript_63572:792-1070(+)
MKKHEALKKTGIYDAPANQGEEIYGFQQDGSDQKAKEYNLKMSRVFNECLLYPGGKLCKADKKYRKSVASSALSRIIVTLLRHTAIDWHKRS